MVTIAYLDFQMFWHSNAAILQVGALGTLSLSSHFVADNFLRSHATQMRVGLTSCSGHGEFPYLASCISLQKEQFSLPKLAGTGVKTKASWKCGFLPLIALSLVVQEQESKEPGEKREDEFLIPSAPKENISSCVDLLRAAEFSSNCLSLLCYTSCPCQKKQDQMEWKGCVYSPLPPL